MVRTTILVKQSHSLMVECVLGCCATIFIYLFVYICWFVSFQAERSTTQQEVVLQYSTTVSHPHWHWTHSISNPVDDMVTAKVSFSRNSSLLSKTGRSIRLKQVLEGKNKGNTDESINGMREESHTTTTESRGGGCCCGTYWARGYKQMATGTP